MKVKDYKIIISSCIANIFEWYDYTLFILFAVAIADNFFPKGDQSLVLIKAFLIFAIGYIVRPLGGIFFGIIGDKLGRKEAVAISTICIALPTTLIGLLPTYQSIGISATISISVIRMLQGLSVGGSLSSSMSFLTEHSSNDNRGITSSLLMSSISVGILLGIVVSSTVQSMMTQAEFNNWGWRVPFLLGSPVILVGIYIKYKLQETPVFQSIKKAGKISQTPLKIVITKYWKEILISIAINATSSIMFYFVAAYLVNYLKFNRKFDIASVDQLNKYCCLVMAFASCLSGWMYDKIGAYKTYIIIILLIVIATCTLVPLIAKADFNTVTYVQVILSILAALYIGSEPALYAALYPDHVRNTALSLSYNIAVSIFGGTAPFIFAYLTQHNNSFNYCVCYIVTWALISLTGILMYKRVHNTTSIKQ